MTSPKEPHYFVAEYTEGVTWRRGTWQNGEAWYRSLFADATSSPARGEASTTYTKWPEYPGVPERIAALLPDVKLLYLVRDPIERMRSHYQHEFIRRAERRPIDQAFVEDPQYLNASRYSTQIAQYLEYFAPSQLMVLTTDQLRDDRAATLSRVYRFIGVAVDVVPENIDKVVFASTERRVHRMEFTQRTLNQLRETRLVKILPRSVRSAGKNVLTTPPTEKPWPSQETVAMLREELRGEMEGLRPFLGEDFDGWGLLDPRAARAT
jgi:hypothetical protein